MSTPYDWDCHIDTDWQTNQAVVIFHRHRGESMEVITGLDSNGRAIVTRYPAETVTPDPTGLRLPMEAIQALAERVKPGPSQGEIKRLEDALAVERGRVDALLARLVPERSP
jgi:hypothetical protein